MVRYTYVMPLDLVGEAKPEWVGEDGGISPYDSTWYCHLPRGMDAESFFAQLEAHPDNKKEPIPPSLLLPFHCVIAYAIKQLPSQPPLTLVLAPSPRPPV